MNNNQGDVIVIPDGDEFMGFDDDLDRAAVAAFDQAHDMVEVNHGEDIKSECREAVLKIFPDICPQYLDEVATQHAYDHQALITAILDLSESGKPVPRRPILKRKRDSEDVGEGSSDVRKKYDSPEWRAERKTLEYILFAKAVLRRHFPKLRFKDIDQVLADNNNTLFAAYLKLAQKEADDVLKPKKRPTKPNNPEVAEEQLAASLAPGSPDLLKAAIEELRTAQALRIDMLDDKRRQERQQQDEKDNFAKAVAEGTTSECECCCDVFPLNRMVHCNGEALHWFCRDCARLNAETQIGLSKFELNCMSMAGCDASFCREQKFIFLDEKTAIALERIEQETALRLAGIEDLETCPFCPYAAEYPPVEVDKEFRCERPECEIVSCRLCRKETHIPKTCDEAALEEGHSGRRAIEEAMSAALIRKCNKCKSPFIKESGCNKMTCSQAGCGNVQCYVCNESCSYSHFNDVKRGGKTGNCPLFDANVEDRHQEEVRRAEEEARKKVQEEHPDVPAEVFEIKVSEKIKEDEDKRRKLDAAARAAINGRVPAQWENPAPLVLPPNIQHAIVAARLRAVRLPPMAMNNERAPVPLPGFVAAGLAGLEPPLPRPLPLHALVFDDMLRDALPGLPPDIAAEIAFVNRQQDVANLRARRRHVHFHPWEANAPPAAAAPAQLRQPPNQAAAPAGAVQPAAGPAAVPLRLAARPAPAAAPAANAPAAQPAAHPVRQILEEFRREDPEFYRGEMAQLRRTGQLTFQNLQELRRRHLQQKQARPAGQQPQQQHRPGSAQNPVKIEANAIPGRIEPMVELRRIMDARAAHAPIVIPARRPQQQQQQHYFAPAGAPPPPPAAAAQQQQRQQHQQPAAAAQAQQARLAHQAQQHQRAFQRARAYHPHLRAVAGGQYGNMPNGRAAAAAAHAATRAARVGAAHAVGRLGGRPAAGP